MHNRWTSLIRPLSSCIFLKMLGFAPRATEGGGGIFNFHNLNNPDDDTCYISHRSLREAINGDYAHAGAQSIYSDIPYPGRHELPSRSHMPLLTEKESLIEGTMEDQTW
jgi:hypothetical protein